MRTHEFAPLDESESRLVLSLLERVLDVPGAERREWLERHCGGWERVQSEVWRLLARDEASDGLPPLAQAVDLEAALGDPVESDLAAGTCVDGFEVVRLIGQGGMGRVFEARQRNPARRVALKMLRVALTGSGARKRFALEAEVLAHLQHPSIAQIFAAGIHRMGAEEVPYFALEFVEGARTLLCHVKEQRLDRRARIELFVQVCEAVHHGHQKGIVHRDLKPANILVGSDGVPKIIDYGVARARGLDTDTTVAHTRTGDVLGTLPYMSPEQLEGDSAHLDRRSDVYSLGVVLSELLCGERPHDLKDKPLLEAARTLRESPPRRPGAKDASIPRDLDVITLHALRSDPHDRYASAAELAADLRRYLSGETILARSPSTWYAARKFAQRNRALVGAVLGFGLLLALAAVVAIGFAVQSRRAEAEVKRKYDEVMHFADIVRVGELIDQADRLWPAWPDRLADLRRWVGEAQELIARRSAHEQILARLEASPEAQSQGGRWSIRSGRELLQSLGVLAELLPDVERRARHAANLEADSIIDNRAAWDEAIASIRASERYGGLTLTPQMGLVPLEENPESGLWEFLCIETGDYPEPTQAGFEMTGATGVILVLLPAGEFRMGAQAQDPQGPNFDPDAETLAGPPHRVELGAFFLSKYELTQGQYRRLTGHNPSFHQMGSEVPGDDSHPVEQVTIEEGLAALARVGLTLPTEAQWEYGARAGTDSPWWSGRSKDSLGTSRAGNVLDAYAARFPATRTWGRHESFDDGFVIHAPVGRFAPNAFGLHDVVGNVWEPCLDVFGPFEPKLHRAGDGLVQRVTPSGEVPFHPTRGGSFTNDAYSARSSNRNSQLANAALLNLGLRPARAVR